MEESKIKIDFTTVYQEFRPNVFRYLYLLSGNGQLAEELTQETFYQAYLARNTFQGQSKISTWITAIARHVYLKEQRRDRKYPQDKADWESLPAPGWDRPDLVMAREERRGEILDILLMLPEDYRSVIIWRELEELSFTDIGAMMEKSPATVRVLLFRAKKRFRDLFSQKYPKYDF